MACEQAVKVDEHSATKKNLQKYWRGLFLLFFLLAPLVFNVLEEQNNGPLNENACVRARSDSDDEPPLAPFDVETLQQEYQLGIRPYKRCFQLTEWLISMLIRWIN